MANNSTIKSAFRVAGLNTVVDVQDALLDRMAENYDREQAGKDAAKLAAAKASKDAALTASIKAAQLLLVDVCEQEASASFAVRLAAEQAKTARQAAIQAREAAKARGDSKAAREADKATKKVADHAAVEARPAARPVAAPKGTVTPKAPQNRKYAVAEIVSARVSNELGDFTTQETADRGTTLSALRPRIGLVDTQAKNCLANMVEGLPEATTIVHIPDVTPKGERLDNAEWCQAFWSACNEFGVPTWTQSSIKAKTFYFVKPEMFARLASKWNVAEDGPKFTAYSGLLFSEMDGSEALNVELGSVAKQSDGQDGNCAVSPTIWGNDSCQFRLMRLDKRDGLPISLGKGIAVPVKGVESLPFNTTQVKWGHAGDYVVLKNRYVGAKPLKMWISAEPILMLQDKPEVRRFLAARTQRKVTECLSYLTDKNRGAMHIRW